MRTLEQADTVRLAKVALPVENAGRGNNGQAGIEAVASRFRPAQTLGNPRDVFAPD